MRNQVAFKQYNPDKPAKYGMLFKSLNDARLNYTYRTLVYAGKPQQLPSPYYVCGTDNYIKRLVTDLEQAVSLQGRNISMDRLYTSIPIAQWLLSMKMTCIGTIMSRRVGIPPELKTTANREELSSRMYWEKTSGDIVLSSYVVGTSKGMKNILVLSTVEPLQGVTKDDGKKKPAIFKLYDFTKGGTDVVDQMIGSYSTKTKSPKWTRVSFCYVLDTARVNATTVFRLKHGPESERIDAFELGWDLAEALVLPFARARSLNGLSSKTQLKLSLLLGNPRTSDGDECPPSDGKRRRCHACVKSFIGQPGYKERKNRLVKVKSVCSRCDQPCCARHLVQICPDCS